MPAFLPGLELSRLFYLEAVRPILDAEFSDIIYSAALIGDGSEALGFDTEMSADHDWGPRLLVFLTDEDYEKKQLALFETLARMLPRQFYGYSTNFGPPDLNDNSARILEATMSSPIQHRVETFTLRGFVQEHLGFDIRRAIEPADWLTFPEQKLRALVAGAVYHDGIGLQALRDRFRYYPQDVWLCLLASGWNRIGQEQHLMGRAGYAGDELGSAIIGARLTRDLMRLCFLMERQYAPYPKWFGTAFARLNCAADLSPSLRFALAAETWQEREQQLCAVYEKVAAMHNALHITKPLPTEVTLFFGRPFKVIFSDFPGALCARITDPEVKRIAENRLIGSVDQFSDSADILSDPQWRPILRRLYE